jgi:mono/diheme cytochrome c family protein
MRTMNTAWFALAFTGALLAAPSGSAAQERGDLARGAEAYGATCGRCHNPRSPVERSDRDWIVIVNHMRARGAGITGQQVRDILAFLQASNHVEEALVQAGGGGAAAPAAPAAGPSGPVMVSQDPADVSAGQALTSAKGCIGCHKIAGGGGDIGPNLGGVVNAKGADFVAQKLTNPAFNNAGTLMPNLGLTQDEIRSLIAYLATLHVPQ